MPIETTKRVGIGHWDNGKTLFWKYAVLTKLHISAIIGKGNMKKATIILLVLTVTIFSCFAESESMTTEIMSISGGPHGFGLGIAPAGTDIRLYRYFTLSDRLQHQAIFRTRLAFSFPNNVSYGGFDYVTGEPNWIRKYHEIAGNSNYISGYYFNPWASAFVYLTQGFGINPVSENGPLVNISIGLNSRFSLALESLDVARGTRDPSFITKDDNGEWIYRSPFEPGGRIQAYPWLQDNRQTLSNYLYGFFELRLFKTMILESYEGFYLSGTVEYGPSWLANGISMNYPTSDFLRLSATMTEYLSLYNKRQKNGWNWLSISLVHTNTLTHTSGSIVPADKLPTDRLENAFSDSLYLKFFGPQFISTDCYTEVTIGLYNYCYFGNVVNEFPQTTNAMEWTSSLKCRLYAKLFGFMYFAYEFGYNFMTGIKTSYPGFWQNAQVQFNVTL